MSVSKQLKQANLETVVSHYIQSLRMKNFTRRTVDSNQQRLRRFTHWCGQRGTDRLAELSSDVIGGFRRYLYHYIDPIKGKPLAARSQADYLISLRSFCRWLVKNDLIGKDPSLSLEIPKFKKSLADVLTLDEVNKVLAGPNVNKPLGIRDRAILETFYSTAIRASELGNLTLADVEPDRKLVRVVNGKGDKDRFVPIGMQALQWIEKYQRDVRPLITNSHSGSYLFIGERGKPLSRVMLAKIVKDHLLGAGIHKRGACHILRHTAATLMLENGADLRSLQLYLGHDRLDTTQIYTHISPVRLQEVHQNTHPTGDTRLKRGRAKKSNDANLTAR